MTLLAAWAIHVNSLPVWGDTDVPYGATDKSQHQAAVKGGRRPAQRTLEGCVLTHPRHFTMVLVPFYGRPTCAFESPLSNPITRTGLTSVKVEGPHRPAEAAAEPPSEGKGGLKQYRRTRTWVGRSGEMTDSLLRSALLALSLCSSMLLAVPFALRSLDPYSRSSPQQSLAHLVPPWDPSIPRVVNPPLVVGFR